MQWKTPSVVDIDMNAEIGGYQSDFDDDRKPFVPPPRAQPGDEPGSRSLTGARIVTS